MKLKASTSLLSAWAIAAASFGRVCAEEGSAIRGRARDLLFLAATATGQDEECLRLVREDDKGVPVLLMDDRTGDLANDADTEEVWRAVHRGFFDVYTQARNSLETPVAMRTQMIYWKLQAAVLAATKKRCGGDAEMLDPFPPHGAPSYKVREQQLNALYQSEEDIKTFRAQVAACLLYEWWGMGLSRYIQGHPQIEEMEEYLLELGRDYADRTDGHPAKTRLVDYQDFKVDVKAAPSCVGNTNNPQCVAGKIAAVLRDWQCDDGWNQCGTDRGTGQLRPEPFKDTIGFRTTHIANQGGDRRNWAPITECNSGFCANQEHVVPHIGFTARTYFLNEQDRKEIVTGVVRPLIVDYKKEIREVIKAMNENVAISAEYKTKISYHDNKFSFAAGTRGIRGRNMVTWEEQIFMQNAFLGVEYEGIIINWQAKVLNNHVRPTTVAQEVLGDDLIEGWQYGNNELATYPAKEWHPYIHVMPHGEFPSGSACLCSAGVAIYAEMFGVPVDEENDLMKVEVDFSKYPNTVEPELSAAFTQTYRLDEYANECSESRFFGGMHYQFSLEPGARMCTTDNDFTKKAGAWNRYLWTGDEQFLAPFGGRSAFGYEGDRDYVWY